LDRSAKPVAGFVFVQPRNHDRQLCEKPFLLSDVPPGCLKGISSDHHFAREAILETRKGVPTNWAGTPDSEYLERPCPFAKPFSQKSPPN
jgi:hypothetical protein